MASMTWSRGFFRLWVAIACLWIGSVTVTGFIEWKERSSSDLAYDKFSKPTASVPPPPGYVLDDPKDWVTPPSDVVWTAKDHLMAREWRSELVQRYIYIGFLPPFVLLAIGFVIRWIARGFRGR